MDQNPVARVVLDGIVNDRGKAMLRHIDPEPRAWLPPSASLLDRIAVDDRGATT